VHEPKPKLSKSTGTKHTFKPIIYNLQKSIIN